MHVMELGGNVPDTKIEHLVTFPLEASEDAISAEQNNDNEAKDDSKVAISVPEGKEKLSDEQSVSKGAAVSA